MNKKSLILAIILIALPIIAVIGFLNYPKTPTVGKIIKPVLNSADFSFKADKITVPCPLSDKTGCSSQREVSLKNNPAVEYKTASASTVLNPVQAKDISVLEDKNSGKKYLYESSWSGSCYVLTYTFPLEAQFLDILSKPAKNLAKSKEVIIQVTKVPLLENNCILSDKSPDFFKKL